MTIALAAADGRLSLQVCAACGAVQYPPRECCHVCLSETLEWREQDGAAELMAVTTLHHSYDPYFRARLPWSIGLARLDAGPSVIAHLHGRCPPPPARVQIGARLDRAGRAVLIAFPSGHARTLTDDPRLLELCLP
jgi:uncharacterized OB-fold protein